MATASLPKSDAMLSFAELLERSSAPTRRRAVPILVELAEAIRPGARVVNDLRAGLAPVESLFAADLHREFKLLGDLVGAAADAEGGLLVEASRRERARVLAILAAARLQTWVRTRLLPVFEYHYKRVLDSTFTILRRYDIRPTDRDALEQKILRLGGKRMGLLDIERDTKESLFKVIDLSREQGLGPRETGRLLRDMVPRGRYVNAGSSYRATMIARTEALHAQRISSIETYRQSPVVKELVAFDGDHDGECAARNGQHYSFDDAQIEADSTHPQCVLAFGPVTF